MKYFLNGVSIGLMVPTIIALAVSGAWHSGLVAVLAAGAALFVATYIRGGLPLSGGDARG